MPRKAHQYHYIYKTTCNITQKFYIGMHSTSNLEDGYMGSGKKLRYSVKKHGLENHIKEILEFLPDRESLAKQEQKIVSQEMLNESLCMNLKIGGFGGFTGVVKHSLETIKKIKSSRTGQCVGEKNTQFGTCWITNGIDNKKVKKNSKIPEGWKFGRVLKT